MSTIGSIPAAGNLYASRATQPKGSAGMFANVLDQAQASSASGRDVATISDAARARLADPMAKYYGEVPIEASADKVFEWTANASAVSKAQGLPDGQYDFTKMNSSQMNDVIGGYIAKGVSMDHLNGLILTASQIADFNPPAGSTITRSADGGMDVSQWLADMYRWNVQQGGTSGREASFLKGSLDIVNEMLKVTGR